VRHTPAVKEEEKEIKPTSKKGKIKKAKHIGCIREGGVYEQ
jgi:hypothetical protein